MIDWKWSSHSTVDVDHSYVQHVWIYNLVTLVNKPNYPQPIANLQVEGEFICKTIVLESGSATILATRCKFKKHVTIIFFYRHHVKTLPQHWWQQYHQFLKTTVIKIKLMSYMYSIFCLPGSFNSLLKLALLLLGDFLDAVLFTVPADFALSKGGETFGCVGWYKQKM